ncbi:glutathione S-transferase T3-like [Primulina tabacum]|uniref:glutathione S-transferase T3-like n=1 Tax=Primulina tabacum TaxID=48773 RepID=UPI003F5AC7A7
MTSSKHGTALSIEEDKLLVMAYLDVSQNPIIGINQSRDRLWSRVAATYNEQLAGNSTEPRTTKALQCHWFNINKIVQNFSLCVSQVELSRPSGASEKDILDQAKALFKQSAGSTWRLDHVWSLLKDQEKFRPSNAILSNFIPNRGNIDSSQSDYSPNTESPTPDSGGLSGFAINLDEDNPSEGCSQRPIGIKKGQSQKKSY